MTSPLVTIVLATYNWSTVLPYSIGSVLAQTFSDFELLVIGDGCTDDSESVVSKIGDRRVSWMNLPTNSGHQSIPNNEGVRRARGQYIAYIGHDDLWLPHHLSGLVAAISTDVDLAYSMTACVTVDNEIGLLPLRFEYQPGLAIPPSSVMHQRSMMESAGGWKHYSEVKVHPEIDLWSRIYNIRNKYAFVPRLSVIKFPASWRKDSYKTRACHEQAAWFERIQNEPDLEAVELGKIIAREKKIISNVQTKPYRYVAQEFCAETLSRIRKRFDGQKHGESIEALRKFKGLEPNQQR